jgi:hypothetical protein
MTYANIQNISIRRNPLQRMFGLATVAVRAAGGGSGGGDSAGASSSSHSHEASFEGVDNAEQIREILQRRIRLHRDSGLGDPDDAHGDGDAAHAQAVAGTAAVPAHAVAGVAAAAPVHPHVAAARALLAEVSALRASGALTAYVRSRP